MSEMLRYDPEDPRWTAYLLGELEAEERTRCEALLERDAAARAEIEALRETLESVQRELRTELAEAPRLDRAPLVAALKPTAPRSGRLFFYLLAAAALVLAAGSILWDQSQSRDLAPAHEALVRREALVPAEVPMRSPAPVLAESSLAAKASASAPAPGAVGSYRVRAVAQEPDALRALGYVSQDADGILLQESAGTETYAGLPENPFVDVARERLSTFSIDVDTASYTNVRRYLEMGQDPPRDAVRLEELVNYFEYDDPAPRGDVPFHVALEMARCPWKSGHHLVRIGLQGRVIPRDQRPASNLVFLIDVSGSMQNPNKLPIVQRSLALLVEELDARDRVAIVTYAGSTGLVLPSTSCGERRAIFEAIERLGAGGSTNGAAGIQLAYETAREHWIAGGSNRVILCTDGDFNVGITDPNALVELVRTKAAGGIFLTALGFGMGNLKDATLEKLADQGNGFYGYVDDMREARKLFVNELTGTLVAIAKDVKIQVDFAPEQVRSFRLLGYENRALAHKDFADDTKDAGEIGAGHDVTALYEVELKAPAFLGVGPEALRVRLRWKEPTGDASRLIEQSLLVSDTKFSAASENLRFGASVALFGMLLRGSAHAGGGTYATVQELASDAIGTDAHGERRAFLELLKRKLR
ncbi:MAG: von Willebrand factor type A domain-containing protein [Planctomycetes bacterium]|nr:von Willebrand factor type A domain-containing protein [Planctomycetota bacterium]